MNRLAIKVENSEKRTHTVYKLNMLEIEQSHLDIRKMNVRRGIPASSEFSDRQEDVHTVRTWRFQH
jgi:hypothetical protein